MMLTDLADAARSSGLPVIEISGWRTAGHGPMKALQTIVCHHTAGPRTGDTPSLAVVIRGRADLPGPLAQLYLSRAGAVYIVAAGLAYHAGPVLLASYGNASAIGIEAEATGVDPWPEAQLDAYARLVAALVRHYKLPPARVLGHKEVCSPPGRKIDPNFDMNTFRARVARHLANPGPTRPPLLQEDDMLIPITVRPDGTFTGHGIAEAGGGGWYGEGLIAVASAWGDTVVTVTALTDHGDVAPLSAPGGDLIANNTQRVYALPDWTRHVTVEGTVENPPDEHGSGTLPAAAWLARRA